MIGETVAERLKGGLEKPKKPEIYNSILDVGVLEPREGERAAKGK